MYAIRSYYGLRFELQGSLHGVFIERIQHQRDITAQKGFGVRINFYIARFLGVRNGFDTNNDVEHF